MRFSHVLILLIALLLLLVMIPIAGISLGFILIDDEFFGKSSDPIEQSWSAGPSPKIIVDNFGGAITIKPSTDGQIKAIVVKNSLCKNLSQEVAQDALRFVYVEMVQDGDRIRIATRPTDDLPKNEYYKTGNYVSVSSSIEIKVPDGARLDLTTSSGSIWVVGKPDEIHAKNQIGIILFELDASRESQDSGPAPGRIKLEGFHGEAEARFDGKAYSHGGIVKPVP